MRSDNAIPHLGLTAEPFTASQIAHGRDAFCRFGKGNDLAELISGDCCAFALAREMGVALLYQGGDFAKIDIPAAL